MAYQVNGTTVIDNNRNLVNIASGAGATVTTGAAAFSNSGVPDYYWNSKPFSSSQPDSSHVFFSHTVSSNTDAVLISLNSNSGPVAFNTGGFYGAGLAFGVWDGSNLLNLGGTLTSNSGWNEAATAENQGLDNKYLSFGPLSGYGGYTIYGMVVRGDSGNIIGGASWSAGDVEVVVVEI